MLLKSISETFMRFVVAISVAIKVAVDAGGIAIDILENKRKTD